MDNTQESETEVNLDDFAQELFTGKPAEKPQVEDESSALDVTEELEEDTLEEEVELEDDTDEPDPEPEPVKPVKKNSAKDRIQELNAKLRETERRLAEATKPAPVQEPKPIPVPTAVVDTPSPQPDELNEDGTEKYPLGEYDPTYIRDLTRHAFKAAQQDFAREQAEAAIRNKALSERQQLQQTWEQKLDPARDRYPDFQEKAETLVNSFSGLDPNYSEYLTTTLMSMDYGTDVLYYLSNNPAEAKKIVNMGARKATLALGRIENKFAEAEAEKVQARPRVSKAPEPPKVVNKGSTASLADDEDDLDVFAAKLFQTRARR